MENNVVFSDALTMLPNDLINEVLEDDYDKAESACLPLPKIITLVIAAAAALVLLFTNLLPPREGIVSAPGVLVMTAYAGEAAEGVVLEEGVEFVTDRSNLAMTEDWSQLEYLLLDFDLPEEYGTQVTFSIESVNGIVHVYDLENYPSLRVKAVVPNGCRISWNPNPNEPSYETRGSFLKIVIKDGESIIGYAIIQGYISESEECVMCAKLLKSVYYPKIQGEYQPITEDYIESLMQTVMDQALTAA